VLAPDQRGYNLSDKPGGLSAYRMDRLAGDVIGLMDALGYEKAMLVGHDWGGVIAWVTAVLHAARVEKLAVLNAPYHPVAVQSLLRHPSQLWKSSYMYFFQLPWLPESMLRRKDWQLMVRGMEGSSHTGVFEQADFERYRRAWVQRGAITGMLNWYRALFRRPFNLPLKPALKMPVLLLWGSQDVALGSDLAEASIRLCADGRLVFFENASHWLQHEEPEAVNQYLAAFMSHPVSP
jgi:pimeloyl-ACP methyl ester carboxylesterase